MKFNFHPQKFKTDVSEATSIMEICNTKTIKVNNHRGVRGVHAKGLNFCGVV
jgi:hypothetical protein